MEERKKERKIEQEKGDSLNGRKKEGEKDRARKRGLSKYKTHDNLELGERKSITHVTFLL